LLCSMQRVCDLRHSLNHSIAFWTTCGLSTRVSGGRRGKVASKGASYINTESAVQYSVGVPGLRFAAVVDSFTHLHPLTIRSRPRRMIVDLSLSGFRASPPAPWFPSPSRCPPPLPTIWLSSTPPRLPDRPSYQKIRRRLKQHRCYCDSGL
jgi:hypothetical protein